MQKQQYNWPPEPAIRRVPKRPITERIPLLYGLKQLANPFIGPKDYSNRPVEKALGHP